MTRLLSKKQVREIVGFSFAHIDRMECDEAYTHLGFPKRVQIGFRVFWVEEEIHTWVAAQIAKREPS
ncbi:MAG: AlpA family phage regulatory protein [Pseudomonadota bacterium]